jgi:F0F1-type ATP synthase assembly protein I
MGRLPPALRLIGIGWYFAICIVGGVVGGVLLGKAFDLVPLFTILGLFLGLAAAFLGGYRLVVEVLSEGRRGEKGGP